ncbi:MAG: PEP-CTERM sorting domain-containing protein [Candidatus Udaeobacter sp.]
MAVSEAPEPATVGMFAIMSALVLVARKKWTTRA